jgi:C1A family cysteine protease
VDLRPQCPPVYDQGQLGSCTGNAIAGAVEFERMRQNLAVFTPSRLFIYYGERVIEGTVSSDSGAEIRDGIKVVATAGVPPETDWPYDISRFADQPPQLAYADAKDDVATQYQRVMQSLAQMKGCLASGLPFVFGFTVYESFESPAVASTGQAPMPGSNESVLGGHAVMAGPLPELLGTRLGDGGLLHAALRLPRLGRPGVRPMGHSAGGRERAPGPAWAIARSRPAGELVDLACE